MELDILLLERLNIVNNIIPKIVKADVMFSIPLIIEYLETLSSNDKIDKDFSKTIKNFYLMDSGCILLDNYKEKRYWDIGNSIGLGLNKYYIGFDPSLTLSFIKNSRPPPKLLDFLSQSLLPSKFSLKSSSDSSIMSAIIIY